MGHFKRVCGPLLACGPFINEIFHGDIQESPGWKNNQAYLFTKMAEDVIVVGVAIIWAAFTAAMIELSTKKHVKKSCKCTALELVHGYRQ